MKRRKKTRTTEQIKCCLYLFFLVCYDRWKGNHKGRVGFFPRDHVVEVGEDGSEVAPRPAIGEVQSLIVPPDLLRRARANDSDSDSDDEQRSSASAHIERGSSNFSVSSVSKTSAAKYLPDNDPDDAPASICNAVGCNAATAACAAGCGIAP